MALLYIRIAIHPLIILDQQRLYKPNKNKVSIKITPEFRMKEINEQL